MESKILVVLSIDHHHSSIYAIPESHHMINKLKQLENLGEIEYFNLNKYSKDNLDTINFCLSLDYVYGKENNSDCLECYEKLDYPFKVIGIINLSIPMN